MQLPSTIRDPKTGQMQRWELGIQRELPYGFVVEAAYIGNRGTHIEINRNFNATPLRFLSTQCFPRCRGRNFPRRKCAESLPRLDPDQYDHWTGNKHNPGKTASPLPAF